jgi:hypothetical protein
MQTRVGHERRRKTCNGDLHEVGYALTALPAIKTKPTPRMTTAAKAKDAERCYGIISLTRSLVSLIARSRSRSLPAYLMTEVGEVNENANPDDEGSSEHGRGQWCVRLCPRCSLKPRTDMV